MTPLGRLADRRQKRRQKALFWIAAAALVGYALFVGDHRPHHLALLWLEEERTEDRITELEDRNRELTADKERLEADTLTLEALAREKGMIRPGDMIYQIVPLPPGVREAAAESLAVRAAREAAARAADSLRLEAGGPSPRTTRRAAVAPSRPAAAPASDPRWKPLGAPRPEARDSSPSGPLGTP